MLITRRSPAESKWWQVSVLSSVSERVVLKQHAEALGGRWLFIRMTDWWRSGKHTVWSWNSISKTDFKNGMPRRAKKSQTFPSPFPLWGRHVSHVLLLEKLRWTHEGMRTLWRWHRGLCGLEVRTVTLLQVGQVQRCPWPWASEHFSTGQLSLSQTCRLEWRWVSLRRRHWGELRQAYPLLNLSPEVGFSAVRQLIFTELSLCAWSCPTYSEVQT